MQVTGVTVHQKSRLPHQPKAWTAFLHDHRHLWMRSKQHAILKIRHLCIRAIRTTSTTEITCYSTRFYTEPL